LTLLAVLNKEAVSSGLEPHTHTHQSS